MTTMRIRILHVVDNVGMGGLQNGLANLIGRLEPSRFEHVFCAMRPVEPVDAQPLPASRATVLCLDERERASRVQIGALLRRIRELKPHIVHSRNWAAIEAVVAARWLGSCRVVHSEHGVDAGTAASEPWHRSRLRRLAFELAHEVMCVSSQLRELHSRRTGFPARRIRVIHNGVDDQRFSRDAETRGRMRAELGIADDEFCIGCVGNLTPVKDHATVLEALAKLNAEYDRWRLLLIGDGPELPRLQEFVKAHPSWQPRITFLGRSKRVPELLNAMDAYVLSSLTEGMCNSLLEAMATGLPVVATATGGNPEVTVDGESGLLFGVGKADELATRLLQLATREDLRVQLGNAALRRVRERFSIDSMVRQYEELYERLGPTATLSVPAAARV
jgi:sugar transferase (PEP-CTERM/EpsH1 system associated)